jgi:hypothetical protein
MSHQKPHLEQGLCLCDCRKCTFVSPDGAEICFCAKCDAVRCGLHNSAAPRATDDD